MAERKQFLLRIDPRLWQEVEKWAAEELRSVNGQIEYLLREAVRRRTGRVSPAAREEAGDTSSAGQILRKRPEGEGDG
jgi:hypothetical protein